LPKNFVLEERLEAYSSVIEPHPEALRGTWASACAPITAEGHVPFSEVRVDLGCGKGSFTAAQAKANPNVLFVAIDTEPICISYAAKTMYEAGVPNAIVVPGTGMKIDEYFSPEEVSVIYLNFPAPFPRIRQAMFWLKRVLFVLKRTVSHFLIFLLSKLKLLVTTLFGKREMHRQIFLTMFLVSTNKNLAPKALRFMPT